MKVSNAVSYRPLRIPSRFLAPLRAKAKSLKKLGVDILDLISGAVPHISGPIRFKNDSSVSSEQKKFTLFRRYLTWQGGVAVPTTESSVIEEEFVLDKMKRFKILDKLPLKVSLPVSNFLGRIQGRFGDRNTIISYGDDIAISFTQILKSVFAFKPDVNKIAVVSGSFATNYDYFNRFMCFNPVYRGFIAKDKVQEAVEDAYKLLSIPVLPGPKPSSVLTQRIKATASPGFTLSKVLKFPNKLEAADVAYEVFKRFYSKIGDTGKIPQHIYICGAREKREDDIKDGGMVKSRGIMIPEMPHSLLEACYAIPVSKILASADYPSPIFIGASMSHLGYSRLLSVYDARGAVFEGDFKSYDSTVKKEIIASAFCIFRSFYEDSEFIDNHFRAMYANFTHKDIITPGGYVFRINQGIPSGSALTSLIGSLCTLIVLCYVLKFYPPMRDSGAEARIALQGDDFIISFDRVFPIEADHFSNWIAVECGMEVKFDRMKSVGISHSKTVESYGGTDRAGDFDLKKIVNTVIRQGTIEDAYKFFLPVIDEAYRMWGYERTDDEFADVVMMISSFVRGTPPDRKKTPPKREILSQELSGSDYVTEDSYFDFVQAMAGDALPVSFWGNAAAPEGTADKAMQLSDQLRKKLELAQFKRLRCHSDEDLEQYIEVVLNGGKLDSRFGVCYKNTNIPTPFAHEAYLHQSRTAAVGATEKCASFLKTIFIDRLPSVAFTDLFLRVLFPLRMYKKTFDPVKFIYSIVEMGFLEHVSTVWVATYAAYREAILLRKDYVWANERAKFFKHLAIERYKQIFITDKLKVIRDVHASMSEKVPLITLLEKGKAVNVSSLIDFYFDNNSTDSLLLEPIPMKP